MSYQGIHIPSQWSEAAESITFASPPSHPPIIFICGPKNTGKSTFARHLVNVLLQRHTQVAHLDTDVGQPEFTPPGCLSLHVLHEQSKGTFSPAQCHFFGDISSKRDPKAYLDRIFHLYDYFHNEHRFKKLEKSGKSVPPLVINTPGWVKGIGYDLLVDMIKYMKPTHVVQIRTTSENKNLPYGAFWSDGTLEENVNLIDLFAACTDSFNQTVLIQKQALTLRDNRIIAYFQQCIPTGMNVSTRKELAHALASIPPYEVSISGTKVLHLHCNVPRSEIFHSLNATIVGLAVSSSEPTGSRNHLPWCVGLGIVRGVDLVKDLLYVITPVPLCHLEKVDLLLQGFIRIPTCLLQVRGCMCPYMSTNVLNKLDPSGMSS
ncbi:unnamed protein product [Spirodela intermedia]|uniref:Uncharacterized protein n=1 Tax=Spirodela intermedia TaxID=51605 RepID=A0A7I8IYN5_SPIIN|nr:unnamed protein product [Spirodela intermedia]CAA6662253.1 unnamed protein product [Spirodela intermedia]